MTSAPLPPHVETAWVRLNLVQRRVLEAVQADAAAACGGDVATYDVLLELSRRPGDALGQAELAERLLFPQYGLSRLLGRLEAEGLIQREPDPRDRRANRVRATPEGLRRREQMWPAYREAILRHVGSKLTEAETRSLTRLLSKLIGRTERAPGGEGRE